MEVRRVLPVAKRRSVGPFVFVDDFGPFEIVNDQSMDVLPHPHIGLATVTYLFEGNMTHRDSIGSVQTIRPGELNWMTAGSGIVHSERLSGSGNSVADRLSGLQTWVALPEKDEETNPAFSHHGESELPVIDADGLGIKILLGKFGNTESPVETLGAPLYAECRATKDSVLEWEPDVEERAVYGLNGMFTVDGRSFGPGELVVFGTGSRIEITAKRYAIFVLIGGPALEKQRYMYWNFVSSSRDRIEAAKEDWKNGRFDPIPNETGRIPLPKF